MQQRDRLSDEEAAAVFRRAAELEVHAYGKDVFDLEAMEEIGGRAGLSPEVIRQAVAELRAGSLPAVAESSQRRELLPPAGVCRERTVPGAAAVLVPRIEAYLRRQCLEQVRYGQHSVWVPKQGVLANLQRGLDWAGKLRFKDISRLTVSVAEAEGISRTHIRFVADLKTFYRPLAVTAAAVPLAGGVVGTAVAVGVAEPGLFGLLPLGAGAGAAAGGWSAVRAAMVRRHRVLGEVLAGFLDQLEHGR